MSESTGDDVPRDPWGNPLPPEDRPPTNPRPDDYPPPFPSDPPGGSPAENPAWPHSRPPQTHEAPGSPQAPPFAPPTETTPTGPDNPPPAPPTHAPPPGNPAWPGAQAPAPTEAPPGWGDQPGPGWGGPGVPPQQQPYPSGGANQGWGHGAPWAPARNDGMAIAAMVCGIVSLTCAGFIGIVLGPLALILGLRSRNRIDSSPGTLRGSGMAITGIVLGAIGVVVSIAYLVFIAANPDIVEELIDRFNTTTTTGG
jgi:hypothetical protein